MPGGDGPLELGPGSGGGGNPPSVGTSVDAAGTSARAPGEYAGSEARFRFHRDWLRVRRQRHGASPDREGLPGGGDGDGPAMDSGEPAGDQLAALALDLAAPPRPAGLLQYGAVPARGDPARLRGGWRVDHLREY